MILTFDVETTTKNKGNPFTASNRLVSYSVKNGSDPASFSYHSQIDFRTALRHSFEAARLIIGFNIKFDLHWAARYAVVPRDGVRIWDCQLAEFIISGQSAAYPSLDECLAKYGLPAKDDKVAEYWALGLDTTDIPREVLEVYNNLDVDLTYQLYLKQYEVMTEKQRRLCFIMGLDLLVLADMERNGILFDKELAAKKLAETQAKLKDINSALYEVFPTPGINLDSGVQLSCLLYGGKFELDYPTVEERVYKSGPKKGETYERQIHNWKTISCVPLFRPLPRSELKRPWKVGEETGPLYATDTQTLKQLRATNKLQKQLIQFLLERSEQEKLVSTYYKALPDLIETMEWGDYIYGAYNQVVARTGRLSSSRPNMQNFSGAVDELLISRYD